MTVSPTNTVGTKTPSLPVRVDGAQSYLSGTKAAISQILCKYPSASTFKSPRYSTGMVSIMNNSSYEYGQGREPATRKRNLSEFADGSRSWSDKNLKENGLAPESFMSLFRTHSPLVRSTKSSRLDIAGYENRYENGYENGYEYEDTSYRKVLDDCNKSSSRTELFENMQMPDCSHIKNKRARDTEYYRKNNQQGWSQFALQAVSIVAEKAWEFCKNSAAIFGGFHAGGGTAYKLEFRRDSDYYFKAVEKPELKKKASFAYLKSTSHANKQPQAYRKFISNGFDDEQSLCTSPYPSKRQHLSNDKSDTLEKNWVVIPNANSTPTKTKSRPTKSKLPVTPKSRSSTFGAESPRYSTTSRLSIGPSNPEESPAPHSYKPPVSHAGSPTLSSTQRASFASPRPSRSYIPCSIPQKRDLVKGNKRITVPKSPESLESKRHAQRWAALLRNDEIRQDESIRRLDSRLKRMIREGKEALGSKIETCMEDGEVMQTLNTSIKKWKY